MPAVTSSRSSGVSRCAASDETSNAGNHDKRPGVRDGMALIYLLLFVSPQILLYLYLRERLPTSARRWLAVVFTVFNFPWLIVAVRMFSGSLWGISRIPYIAPWIAWQLLGWIFCGLVAVYVVGKAVWRLGGWAVRKLPSSPTPRPPQPPTPGSRPPLL